MNEENNTGILVLQEQLERLERQKTAVEERLQLLLRDGTSTIGDPFPGKDPPGGDRDIVGGVFMGEKPATIDLQIRVYRRVVAARTGKQYLQGLDARMTDIALGQGMLDLMRLYVHLDTDLWARTTAITDALKTVLRGQARIVPLTLEPGEGASPASRALNVMEAAILRPYQVLLGRSGAGKTTFVKYLANALATGNEKRLSGWPAHVRDHLPVLVNMREFADWLGAQGDETDASLLWTYIIQDLRERNLSFLDGPLQREFEQGRFVLLLDGLDEVPARLVSAALASIENCVDRYPLGRYLVTCRLSAYRISAARLPEDRFPCTTLAPLNAERIDGFIGRWFGEFSGHMVTEDNAERLRAAVRQPEMRPLAGSPMLLILMALIHSHHGDLPETETQLYEEAVAILLWRWEQNIVGQETRATDMLRQVGRDRTDLMLVFERLAYETYAAASVLDNGEDGVEQIGGIGENRLIDALRGLHPEGHLDWAQKLVDILRLRSGLLVEGRNGVFSFLHRSVHEYLAGAYLVNGAQFLDRACTLADDPGVWRAVILRSVGLLVHNRREIERPLRLVEMLCPSAAPDDDREWRRVWTAAYLLLEIGLRRARDSKLGSNLLERVAQRLSLLIEGGLLAPVERAEAGDLLGRLGDPRFDRARFHLPQQFRGQREKSMGLVGIRPGLFVMGSRAGDEGVSPDEFGNPTQLSMTYPYWITRYPVTVAAYRDFIKAAGYGAEEHWGARGWEWKQHLERMAPDDFQRQRRFPNRPVVGVTWYEAMAYAAWLDAHLRQRTNQVPKGYQVRLPTEAEWEKAAGGGAGRRYAWGDDWHDDRANTGRRVNHPSTVGMYPLGATANGVMDMTGNVSEWCLSVYEKYPYNPEDGRNTLEVGEERAVRGGSWLEASSSARNARRLRFAPDSAHPDVGFRLVLSRLDSMF